jgi:membrane-bound lytic murein transglycosylase D
VHDERDFNVIYETLRFWSDTSEAARSREVDAHKSYYQATLKSLAAGKRFGLTTNEARVLALFRAGVSNATLSQAVYDIRFKLGQSERFLAGLMPSGRWEGYIRRAFAAPAMPEELAVLSHGESSFNPEAYSRYGEADMWQFMPFDGQR